ncbi:MAG: hypothetical protein QM749_12725 [Aquabacterium sp.]
METDISINPSVSSMRDLLRNVSLVQAQQYFDGEAITLDAQPENLRLGQVLTRYIAMVLLTSAELRIVFKVHFNPEQIRAYQLGKGGTEETLTDRHLVDFMKELSNQMGGRVCRVFDAHQIAMGMSIPLCTRGIYEIYADYRPKTGAVTKFGDFWRLEGPFSSIYCSCYVELISKDDFSHVKHTDEQSQEGELDFL